MCVHVRVRVCAYISSFIIFGMSFFSSFFFLLLPLSHSFKNKGWCVHILSAKTVWIPLNPDVFSCISIRICVFMFYFIHDPYAWNGTYNFIVFIFFSFFAQEFSSRPCLHTTLISFAYTIYIFFGSYSRSVVHPLCAFLFFFLLSGYIFFFFFSLFAAAL